MQVNEKPEHQLELNEDCALEKGTNHLSKSNGARAWWREQVFLQESQVRLTFL